jgi:excisionase family DNA binding protein
VAEEWLTMEEVSEELKIPVRTVISFRQSGDFPPVYRFGHRHNRVKRSDFEAWKEAKSLD